jgi:hypothetical protein
MGNGSSIVYFSTIPNKIWSIECIQSFEYLENKLHFLYSDLMKLYQIYNDMNHHDNHYDGVNGISTYDVIRYYKLENTPCNNLIFSHLKINYSTKLSFIEFVIILWNFLTLTKQDMKYFILSIYNINSEYHTNNNILMHLLNNIHNSNYNVEDCKNNISHFHYSDYIESHQNLMLTDNNETKENITDSDTFDGQILSPLLDLQKHMRSVILGNHRWLQLCADRTTLPAEYSSIYYMQELRCILAEFVSSLHDSNQCGSNNTSYRDSSVDAKNSYISCNVKFEESVNIVVA